MYKVNGDFDTLFVK